MNGILPLYKPKGLTSHDCVMKVRKILNIKKVGHTGTLDPGVEGVLPICIGEATKIIPFLLELKKVYIADVTLGQATTTEDSDGEVVLEKVVTPPTNDEVDQVLAMFQGEIKQIPPMYSAVKVKGKKLYEYARQNKEIERPERIVTIHEIERLATEAKSNHSFRIKVTCSKGTYIRTLCVDIGKKLGYPAHMAYLERVESDSFSINETVTFTKLNEAVQANEVENLLLPVKRGLIHLNVYNVDEELKQKVLYGQKLQLPEDTQIKSPFVMMFKDELLAVYEKHKTNENEIKPIRVFNIHKRV